MEEKKKVWIVIYEENKPVHRTSVDCVFKFKEDAVAYVRGQSEVIKRIVDHVTVIDEIEERDRLVFDDKWFGYVWFYVIKDYELI